jgi:adenosylmethionine-8-amino-7-oxononanoate aminotransferase
MPIGMAEEVYVKSLLEEFEPNNLETGSETIAAFIAEPFVAAALGKVPPTEGYFDGMYAVSHKYGILTILDEILSGFERTVEKFGINNFNVKLDIISPFRCPCFRKCWVFYMKKILSLNRKRLEAYEIVGDIRGVRLQCGVELVSDKETKMPFPAEFNLSRRIGEKSVEKGVVLYPCKVSYDGKSGDHIMIRPPLKVNEEQLDEIILALEESLKEVMVEFNAIA